jgi:hypothetical protein
MLSAAKIVVDRAAWRQILGECPPLAASAQHIHQTRWPSRGRPPSACRHPAWPGESPALPAPIPRPSGRSGNADRSGHSGRGSPPSRSVSSCESAPPSTESQLTQSIQHVRGQTLRHGGAADIVLDQEARTLTGVLFEEQTKEAVALYDAVWKLVDDPERRTAMTIAAQTRFLNAGLAADGYASRHRQLSEALLEE